MKEDIVSEGKKNIFATFELPKSPILSSFLVDFYDSCVCWKKVDKEVGYLACSR